MRTARHLIAVLATVAIGLGCSTIASAQMATDVPSMKVLSPGKVDMVDGQYGEDVTDLSVGPEGGSLDFVRVAQKSRGQDALWTNNWQYSLRRTIVDGGYNYAITNSAVGKTWYNPTNTTIFTDLSFNAAGGTSKLAPIGTGTSQYFKYTGPDGTIIQFEPGSTDTDRWAQSLTRPDGLVVQFQYDNGGTSGAERLRRVFDNRGYILILEYNIAGNADAVSKVCAINAAFTTPPATNSCPAGARSVSYTYNSKQIASVTDTAGKVGNVTVTFDTNGRLVSKAYFKPGLAQPYLTNTYSPQGVSIGNVVTGQVFANGPTYTYDYEIIGSDFPYVEGRGSDWLESTGIGSGSVSWGALQANAQVHPVVTPMPLSVTSAGMTTNYTLNGEWTAITDKQLPSGLTTHYTYGGTTGSALTEVRQIPPSGSTDPQIATGLTYSCTNDVVCFKPVTKTDPLGNVTNYTYDPVHGGVLTETDPAPTTGGIRPQKRYTYQQFYARYRNSTGTVVQAPSPIWKLVQISECQTTASCAGTADEVRTTIAYPSGTGAFNLIPVSKTVAAGDGTVSAATSFTYDGNGDKLTEDGPLPGTSDTTRYRYDVTRRLIGVVGPDPDGAGALKNRAVRNTYDDAGRLTMVEHGTVNSQSDTDWAAFAPLERTTNSYDLQDRVVKSVNSGKNGASFVDETVTQKSYDAIGRLVCTAIRMDPTQWNSQADACVPQTTGPNGPDRITKNTYNSQNLVTKTEVAYGTALSAPEVTNTYTADGKLATITDGENNTTTFEYDGLDRLVKTRFPVTTQGALASSTTDYEQLTRDLDGNVTAKRLRDGTSIGYTFDHLNRMTVKDLPGTDPDVNYAYDNLGRTTSASETGNALFYTYDALGRQLTEGGPLGTTTSTFDPAGRRTTLAYPGTGLTLNYDYLVTGEMQKIRENNATTGIGVLATYAYDDLGRRTSMTRGNGTVASYAYDPMSRLTSFTEDFAGTASDLTISGFGYNPASEITGYARSNDAYAWTGAVAVTRGYAANGLNQYATAGPASFTYDSRGNLTSDGSTNYGYDSENKLVSASGATTGALSYDPKQRLYQVVGTSTIRFAYDGIEAIAEYDGSGNLLRRYVHGPSDDDPILQYEGSTLNDRRWFHTDERGSIVASSDASGNKISINTYDEYGIPGSSNTGRFQYTGQMWLPELGMYYYKARVYSPTLGRFLQTDPTGYDDGPNWYAYVANDPINGRDPTGTDLEAMNLAFSVAASAMMSSMLVPDAAKKKPASLNNSNQPPPSTNWQSPVSGGVSASGAVIAPGFGASASGTLGLNLGPINGDSTVYLQGQVAAGVEAGGGFAAAGLGPTMNYGPAPTTGFASSSHVEADVGGPALSGSASLDRDKNGRISPSGGLGGRGGAGPGGAGAFVGRAETGTLAIKVNTTRLIVNIILGGVFHIFQVF